MSPIARLLQNMRNKTVTDSMEANDMSAFPHSECSSDAIQVVLALSAHRRYRSELVELGAVELLVELFGSTSSSAEVREKAAQSLLQFALDKRTHTRFHACDSLSALLHCLQASKNTHGENPEAVFTLLHCLLTSPILRLQFVQLDGISTMADFIFSGSELQKEHGAFALWLLAAVPAIQPHFLTTKAIAALVSTLEENGSSDLINTSLSALALLAENAACRDVLLAEDMLPLHPRVVKMEAREEVAHRAEHLEQMLHL